jgi:hypothetical protein
MRRRRTHFLDSDGLMPRRPASDGRHHEEAADYATTMPAWEVWEGWEVISLICILTRARRPL